MDGVTLRKRVSGTPIDLLFNNAPAVAAEISKSVGYQNDSVHMFKVNLNISATREGLS